MIGKTVVIGYSARQNSLQDHPALFFKPSPIKPHPNSWFACDLMDATEERDLLEQIDTFIMDLHTYLPSEVFSWQGIDLSPVMILDFQSILAEWVLFALSIKRFLEEQIPDQVILEEYAERPWVGDLIRTLLPQTISLKKKTASLKAKLTRIIAPLGTKWRGLPISGRELPDRIDYLVLLQNAFTDHSNLAPIIKALAGRETMVLATDPEAVAVCEQRDYRFCTPGDFGPPNRSEERRFSISVKPTILNAPLPQDWVISKELHLPLRSLFIKYFPYLPNTYLFQLHRFYGYAYRALQRLKPKLVILAQDIMRAGSATSLAARQLHIPTLCIQHGVTGTFDHGFLPVHATKLATWGKWSRDYLISRGGDAEKLEICGCPYIQPLMENYLKEEEKSTGNENIVSLFTNPSGMAHQRQIVQALAFVRHSFPQYRFVIKLHPAERDFTYKKYLEETPGIEIWNQSSTTELLKKSALTILYSSGVGLETLLLKRALLIVNFTGRKDILGAGTFGAVPYITKPDRLHEAIRLALQDQTKSQEQRKNEFLRQYFNNFYEDPVAAILSQGEELIRNFARS